MRTLLAGWIFSGLGCSCLWAQSPSALPASPPPLGPKSAVGVNQLSQNAIQTAFQLLRRDYIRREELTFEELNRAALQGLLDRLSFGAELETAEQKKDVAPGVLSEFIAPGVAYVRPESFGEGEGGLFVQALNELKGKGAKQLILDLRSGNEGLFEEAALMLQCFMPEGQLMFKMRQMGEETAELFISKGAPLWTDAVVVLVDTVTGNAAEALAAGLQKRGQVWLIGEKTRGATVRYTRLPLDGEVTLRYANAEMLLPDDSSIFKKGLKPDFVVKMPRTNTERIIELSRGNSIKPFVSDNPRPRFNEASLLQGTNPELDAMVQRSAGKEPKDDNKALRDRVVQRAVDWLTARSFLEGSRIGWRVDDNSNQKASEEEKKQGE